MTKIAALKAQAKNLRAALSDQGIAMTLGQAQEAIAKQYGIANWDTLSALLGRKPNPAREPVLADLPGMPSTVTVERGLRAEAYNVEDFDWDVIELLHKPAELQAFLEQNKATYSDGLDTCVLMLMGPDDTIELTAEMLQAGCYRGDLGGKAYWFLPDDDMYLGFDHCSPWTVQDEASDGCKLTVPEVVKSAKGIQVVALRSHDGSKWDHFVMVPPHIPVQGVVDRLSTELKRLKALDAEQQNDASYQEYTADDVRKFVESLGCTWVDSLVEIGDNWDV